MGIPETLQRYLGELGVSCHVIGHSPVRRIQRAASLAGVDPATVARGVLLRTPAGPALAVLPADRVLSFPHLDSHFGGTVEIIAAAEASTHFPGCAVQTTPAAGPAWNVRTVVDQSLFVLDRVVLAAGMPDGLLAVSARDFARLFVGCARAAISDRAPGALPETPADEAARALLPRLCTLPPMPGVALDLLRISQDGRSSVREIARVVEQDPSLAAQVVGYARSPFFGAGCEIDNVHDAVARVLGTDFVVHLALGLAAGKAFRNPRSGPLGLVAFWEHATLTAAVTQELARQLPSDRRPAPGIAYLSGLLHNIGFLVLGHLFRPEFEMLNRLAAVNERTRVTDIERQVLAMGEARHVMGLGHSRLGALLLRHWRLPEACIAAAEHHHDPEYAGPHSEITALVMIADRLARRLGLGDGDSDRLPMHATRLALDPAAIDDAFERILDRRVSLERFAHQLAA